VTVVYIYILGACVQAAVYMKLSATTKVQMLCKLAVISGDA